MRAFLTEVKPLAALLEQAKAVAVKRRPKPESERGPPPYVAPPASAAAMARIQGLLEAMVEPRRAHLEEMLAAAMRNALDRFLRIAPGERGTDQRRAWEMALGLSGVSALVRPAAGRPSADAAYEAVPDAEERIKRDTEQQARSILDAFVRRNLEKVDGIIEGKGGDYASAEVLRCELARGAVEGAIRFAFDDGSSFVAALQLVVNHSSRGLAYAQYPLTFRDVVLPNGERMATPSEERMNSLFAGVEEAGAAPAR